MKNQKDRVPLEHYKAKFAALDPAGVSRRCMVAFTREDGLFSLTVLGQTLRVRWPVFSLTPVDASRCPGALYGAAARILIIRYLIGGSCVPSTGRFLSYRELPWGEVYARNFDARCVRRLAVTFGARLVEFSMAARYLAGTGVGSGDAAAELPFLPELRIRLILRAGDEEFPPNAQFLFSDNAALAFSAEDLAVVGDIVVSALKETVSLQRSASHREEFR